MSQKNNNDVYQFNFNVLDGYIAINIDDTEIIREENVIKINRLDNNVEVSFYLNHFRRSLYVESISAKFKGMEVIPKLDIEEFLQKYSKYIGIEFENNMVLSVFNKHEYRNAINSILVRFTNSILKLIPILFFKNHVELKYPQKNIALIENCLLRIDVSDSKYILIDVSLFSGKYIIKPFVIGSTTPTDDNSEVLFTFYGSYLNLIQNIKVILDNCNVIHLIPKQLKLLDELEMFNIYEPLYKNLQDNSKYDLEEEKISITYEGSTIEIN